MGVLSGAQIGELTGEGKLVIRPFAASLVQPASYDLTLGSKVLASPLSHDILGAVIELNDKSPSYRIQSGQMVAVLSAETVGLPLDISGRFGIRSEFARRGLNAFGGLQLDPGFKGRLVMNVLNVGPEPISITAGVPFFSVEFQRLESPAREAYSGKYQHQDDFPSDLYDFILKARTTSLAEIPTLRQEVSRLSGLLEELQEMLRDPDEGLELKPEVRERLLRSQKAPTSAFISMSELRKKLGV